MVNLKVGLLATQLKLAEMAHHSTDHRQWSERPTESFLNPVKNTESFLCAIS